jgi:hypothetical protein
MLVQGIQLRQHCPCGKRYIQETILRNPDDSYLNISTRFMARSSLTFEKFTGSRSRQLCLQTFHPKHTIATRVQRVRRAPVKRAARLLLPSSKELATTQMNPACVIQAKIKFIQESTTVISRKSAQCRRKYMKS